MINMLQAAWKFLKSLGTPSPKDQNPHWFYCTAVAHSIAAAAGFSLLPFITSDPSDQMWASIIITIGYLVFKELRDIRKGGSTYDSIMDALFVGLGMLYAWYFFFHTVLIAALFATAFREAYIRRG